MGLIKNINYFRLIKELNSESFEDGKPTPLNIMNMSMDELEDINIDVFELIHYKVLEIIYSDSNSLIITGQSGLGKSFDVEKTLTDVKADFEFISGGISSAGLYETLFTENGRLIVFDDCDSVFDNEESLNILKSALDSKPIRRVSRPFKTYFNTKGMTMNDIMANHKGDKSLADNPNLFDPRLVGRMPKNFIYTGKIIFISNRPKDKIDPNLITRASANIDVRLTHDEVLDRMKKVMRSIYPNVPFEKKEEVLRLVDFLTMNYKTKNPLSIRGLVSAIKTRISNDFLKTLPNGKKIPMWQLMIKDELLGKNVRRRSK